jgi:hypothetical protein
MSHSIPFTILPRSGYLNDIYRIIINSSDLDEIVVYLDGQEYQTISTTELQYAEIKEFRFPGQYKAKCIINGFVYEQQILVKNSYRLGSSVVNDVYVFDDSDYIFFTFKDRLQVYNCKTANSYIQNHLSPSKIYCVDESTFLFLTEFPLFTNIALYSTLSHSIVFEYLDHYKIQYHDEVSSILYLTDLDKNELIKLNLFDFIQNKSDSISVFDYESFYINTEIGVILLEGSGKITVINLVSHLEYFFDSNDICGVDFCGNVINIRENKITYQLLQSSYQNEVGTDLTVESDFLFHSKDYFVLNSKFDADFLLASEVRRIVEFYSPSFDNESQSKIIKGGLSEKISFRVFKLYPLSNKLIYVIEHQKHEIRFIDYAKDNLGKITGIPNKQVKSTFSLNSCEECNSKEYFKCYSIEFQNYFNRGVLFRFQKDSFSYRTTYAFLGINGNVQINGQITHKILGRNKEYIVASKVFSDTESLIDLDNPTVFLLSNVKIIRGQEIQNSQKVWFLKSLEDNEISIFDLNRGIIIESGGNNYLSQIGNYSSLDFKADYIKYSNLYLTHSGKKIEGVSGLILKLTSSHSKIILKENGKIYFLQTESFSEPYSKFEIDFSVDSIHESYLMPNSKQALINRHSDLYELYDFETRSYTEFFSGKFLSFYGEDFVMYNDKQFRNPVIIDPKSFDKIELENLKYYKFQSPDQSWHISTSHISRHYSVLKNNFIDEAEYLELSSRLNLINAKDDEHKIIVKKNILEFFNENLLRLSELGINDENKFVFANLFYITCYAIVTNTAKNENYYLELPRGTQYFNYASFSFDSKYISCVGCYNMSQVGGFFVVARISDIDLANNIIRPFFTWRTSRAAWVCGFSFDNKFATYDSTPSTYFIDCDVWENSTKHEIKKIDESSFLCFSPTGKYIALSIQGYDPVSLNGSGHQKSSVIKVLDSQTLKLLSIFDEHGDSLRNANSKNLVSVMFSKDEKLLMSLSQDGVLIIREFIQHDTANSRKPIISDILI